MREAAAESGMGWREVWINEKEGAEANCAVESVGLGHSLLLLDDIIFPTECQLLLDEAAEVRQWEKSLNIIQTRSH